MVASAIRCERKNSSRKVKRLPPIPQEKSIPYLHHHRNPPSASQCHLVLRQTAWIISQHYNHLPTKGKPRPHRRRSRRHGIRHSTRQADLAPCRTGRDSRLLSSEWTCRGFG